jgi:hypothetical protein
MGSTQSTHATPEINEHSSNKEVPNSSVSGQKNLPVPEEPQLISTDEEDNADDASSIVSSDDEGYESDDDEGDEEEGMSLQVFVVCCLWKS